MPAGWQQSLQEKNQIISWRIQGKLGIQTEKDGGSLDVFWSQQGDAYQIRMIAPMGQGAVLIRGNRYGVTVKTADGEEQSSDTVDTLPIPGLDVSLPLTGLRDWVRGMPIQDQPFQKQKWDDQGRLVRLKQNDWDIEMFEYKKVAGQMLPHRFYLGRKDRPELGIRLLIHSWILKPA